MSKKEYKFQVGFFVIKTVENCEGGRTTGDFPFEKWAKDCFSKGNIMTIQLCDGKQYQPADIKEYQDGRYLAIRFFKSHDILPPVKIKDKEAPKEIDLDSDEEIAEPLVLVYDTEKRILAGQINRLSLPYSTLEKIMTNWLASTERVEILEIIDKSTISSLKTNRVKSLQFKVANISAEDLEDEYLNDVVGNSYQADSDIIAVVLSKSRAAGKYLDKGFVAKFLNVTQRFPGKFKQAKIKTAPLTGPFEEHDLLQNRIRKQLRVQCPVEGVLPLSSIADSILLSYREIAGDLYNLIKAGRYER